MKTVAFFIFLSVFLFSCRKDRICECTTTWTFKYSSGNGYDTRIFPSDSKTYNQRFTKSQAINACKHQRASVQTSFEDIITDHGADPLVSGEKIETECDLH